MAKQTNESWNRHTSAAQDLEVNGAVRVATVQMVEEVDKFVGEKRGEKRGKKGKSKQLKHTKIWREQ